MEPVVIVSVIIAAIVSIFSSLWQILLSFKALREVRQARHSEKLVSSHFKTSRRTNFISIVNLILTICLLGSLLYFFQLKGALFQGAQASSITQTIITATTPDEIYDQATSGTPALDEPLSDNSTNEWTVSTGPRDHSCSFTNGTYSASVGQNNPAALCVAQFTNFSNMAYEVQMMFAKTSNADGGILFRADAGSCKLYYFIIDPQGDYWLYLSVGCGGVPDQVLLQGNSSYIHTGLYQPNLIAVVALGNTIYLYANAQYIGKVSDKNFRAGQIGVLATSAAPGPGEVMFRNAQVWGLKQA